MKARRTNTIVAIIFDVLSFCILATVATTGTSGASPLDFTITSSNTYRPLTFTEKVFTDDWAKKLQTNNHRKEQITTQGLFNLVL